MYSHGMVASGGELVTVAGQVGIGPQGVAGPDVGSQTRQAFENVRAIVRGGRLHDGRRRAAPDVSRERRRHPGKRLEPQDRKSTRLNSSHGYISYAVFCLK